MTTPVLTEFDKASTSEESIHLLLYAYAQSINRLKKEAAGRVLDYWFAWTGVEFFKKLVNVRYFKLEIWFSKNKIEFKIKSERFLKYMFCI